MKRDKFSIQFLLAITALSLFTTGICLGQDSSDKKWFVGEGWYISGFPSSLGMRKIEKEGMSLEVIGQRCRIEPESITKGGHGYYHERSLVCDMNGTEVSEVAQHFTAEYIADRVADFQLKNSKGTAYLKLEWISNPLKKMREY